VLGKVPQGSRFKTFRLTGTAISTLLETYAGTRHANVSLVYDLLLVRCADQVRMALTAARPTLSSVRSVRSGLTPVRHRLTVRGNTVRVAASKEQAVGEEASSLG